MGMMMMALWISGLRRISRLFSTGQGLWRNLGQLPGFSMIDQDCAYISVA
jgi:hypothetical protein